MNAEYQGNEGFLQRDSVEHKGYAEVQSTDRREGRERDGASDLLEAILDRNNLNRAYKRVKRNHGAAGIDGMTVEESLPWLKEHREELLRSIRDGSYMPSPVRRKEIPKSDGGVRKLGIPTVVDRVIQQAIAQKLQSIWEPLFSDSSYGYRPRRSAQQAIQKVKEYAEEGYRYAVSVDLSKYFDTLPAPPKRRWLRAKQGRGHSSAQSGRGTSGISSRLTTVRISSNLPQSSGEKRAMMRSMTSDI